MGAHDRARLKAPALPRPADPIGDGHTLVSERRVHEVEERRVATQRLLLVGCIAWPTFIIADFLAALNLGQLSVLPELVVLRLVGEVCAISAYATVRRDKAISGRMLTAIDFGVFGVGGLIVGLQAIPLGGLNSHLVLGVLTLAFTRAALLPSHGVRTFIVAGTTALMFPLVMGVAAAFVPAIREQWTSRAGLGTFAYDFTVTFAAIAIGSLGSHMGWAARRQVLEARKLGSYRLKARIGGGGNGDVWLARQDPLGRSVALKVLKESGSTDEETIRRFEREARAASQLRHPNTIRIFEFGASDDGVLFIAMELLDGMDLDSLVEMAGPLPPARAIHLARQACGSLAEAHDAGIIHRDIKPANFFVTHVADDPDFLKLLDFGVARVAFASNKPSTLTESGIMFGTPAYMSPEVCSGEVADTRSDIYSLGAVLYFMVTGTPVFPDRSFGEIVMSHVSRPPDAPSLRLGAPVPADLEKVILRCLEKKPDARFESVRELADALAACEDADRWKPADARGWWKGLRQSVKIAVSGAA